MIKLAVILAAGVSKRLNNAPPGRPKGFVNIGGETLISRSIACLKKHGIERILIGTGYGASLYEQLAECVPGIITCKCRYYRTTGSFYTLYNMRNLIQEDFLLLESDLIYEERAISQLLRCGSADTILASGRTYSKDEVYIQADADSMLVNMSKDETDLQSVCGELVGISKFSAQTLRQLCALFENNEDLLKNIEYEYAFTMLSRTQPIKIQKVENLIWAEIDTPAHLSRVKTLIYPKLNPANRENTN